MWHPYAIGQQQPMAHGSHGALWSECAPPTWTPTCVRRESIFLRRRSAGRALRERNLRATQKRWQGGFEGLAQARPTRSARLALRARLDACKRQARRSETLEPDPRKNYESVRSSDFVKHRLGTISTPEATSIPYRATFSGYPASGVSV